MNLRLYSETTLDDTERKFRDISDPLIREDILCSLVKNITRSKNIVPRTSSTKLSQADLDILDVYFKNRSTSDDPRQWLATRIFQLYEPSSDLFDRSLIFSVTSEQTESILKGGTVAPPILSIAAEKERKKQAVDLYLERFMAYLLYFEETYARSSNTSQGRIERLRSQIEEKFGYIQSVKQQFISRITTLRQNKKASDLVEYLRAISLRRADDPITGFIRSIIRESGLPIPRESSNGDWEYFGATVSSKTLPLYTSFLFSKNQGMYLDFHLEISPPFPIQFTENSVF